MSLGDVATAIRPCADFISNRRRMFLVLACILLFLVSLARYWVRYDPSASVPYYPEPYGLARNLYHTGKFANPFPFLQTGPSAHLSPVFPAFLALLMKVFGEKSLGFYAIQLSAALILSLQLALFPVFSQMLGMGEINGFIGAAIWIVAKPMLFYGWEALYAAILVAAACCCYRRYLDEQPQARRRLAWLLGSLMGLLILISQAVAAIYATWLAWEVWHQKTAFFKRSFLALVLLPVVIIAPWTIRNYVVFHSFVLIRDNFGSVLSVSNNDCSQFGLDLDVKSGCFQKNHPFHDLNEASKVVELGEVDYNKLQLHTALRWITGNPARFSKLTFMRFIAFWLPTETFTVHYAGPGRRLERVAIYLMTLLSAPGLIILYRRDVKSAAILMSCLVVFPLVYYISEFDARYRYPIMWITFLLGALPITACSKRLWGTFATNAGAKR